MKILIFDGCITGRRPAPPNRAEFVSLGLSRLIVFMLSDIALYIPACYPLTCAEYAYAREPAAKN